MSGDRRAVHIHQFASVRKYLTSAHLQRSGPSSTFAATMPADESTSKVSVSDSETGVSDAGSNADHPPTGSMFGGIFDTRILRDPNRFQGMAASWK